MKKALCFLVSLVLLIGCTGLPAFAEGYATPAEANAALDAAYGAFRHLGDVDGSDTVTAKDARAILLYSAELYDRITDCAYLETDRMDLDHDGVITAVDARRALRYSAKLISANDLMTSDQKLGLFNTILNNLKGNKQTVQFHYATKDTTTVSWDNASAVNSFDSQLNNLAKADDAMEQNGFSNSLRAAEGTNYFSPRSVSPRLLNYTDIPLTGADVSSRLTKSDVKSIEFKTNQSVTLNFTYRVVNGEPLAFVDPVTLMGLNAITVTLPTDSATGIPQNYNSFRSAKLLDLPAIDDIRAESEELGTEMQGVKESMAEMEDLGVFRTCTFDLTTKISAIKVRNVVFTVYFTPETGKPVATVFDYDFDYTTRMSMNIDLAFNWSAMATTAVVAMRNKGVSIKDHIGRPDDRAILQIKNQNVNVTNTRHTYANYYFIHN